MRKWLTNSPFPVHQKNPKMTIEHIRFSFDGVPEEIDGGAKNHYQYEKDNNQCTEYGEHVALIVALLATSVNVGCIVVIFINAWTNRSIGAPAIMNFEEFSHLDGQRQWRMQPFSLTCIH